MIINIILLTMSCTLSAHNVYDSDITRRLCEAVGIKSVADTISDGHYIDEFKHNGHHLSIIVQKGKILSIGYRLFSKEQREAIPFDIANFLERYALEADANINRDKTFARQMKEDDFLFEKGDFKKLHTLQDADSIQLSIENQNNKRYKITWGIDGEILCSLSFPIDYNLILGKDLVECEQTLLTDIANLDSTLYTEDERMQPVSLEKLFEPNYFINRGSSFAVDQLNSSSYYKEIGDGEFELVFSKHLPAESLANLFITNQIDNNVTLRLKVILYDFKDSVIEVPLQPLLSYFKGLGCKAYYGVVEKNDDGIVSEIMIENNINGYCHILKLTSNEDTFDKKSGIMEGRMNIFIPTSKIKHLFQEHT